jgi:hypothetical protein
MTHMTETTAPEIKTDCGGVIKDPSKYPSANIAASGSISAPKPACAPSSKPPMALWLVELNFPWTRINL